jgi:hypothetical protein
MSTEGMMHPSKFFRPTIILESHGALEMREDILNFMIKFVSM